MQKVVTLRDVAESANVSKMTVSNVFSHPERVRPELRARVEEVAARLGYQGPDPKGRLLSSGKVNAIGVVSLGAFGISLLFKLAYAQKFLAGVADVCEERDVGLSLVSAREDQAASGIKNALVDGFIFHSLDRIDLIERARHRRLRVVVIDIDAGPDVSSISIDHRDGMRQATRHLLALGHRRFVIGSRLWSFRAPIFHPPSKAGRQLLGAGPQMRERIAGVAEALGEAGIALEDVPIVETCGTPDEEAAFGSGADLILDTAPEATAVIALGDRLALSVLDKARERGISVPRDLSVVGFDDDPEAALADPPLTTVAQPAFEKGRMAAEMLLEGGPPRQVVLPVKLVIRRSTAPPSRDIRSLR
jgi:DNA-binding LacI/PurR family transcriptional regulator